MRSASSRFLRRSKNRICRKSRPSSIGITVMRHSLSTARCDSISRMSWSIRSIRPPARRCRALLSVSPSHALAPPCVADSTNAIICWARRGPGLGIARSSAACVSCVGACWKSRAISLSAGHSRASDGAGAAAPVRVAAACWSLASSSNRMLVPGAAFSSVRGSGTRMRPIAVSRMVWPAGVRATIVAASVVGAAGAGAAAAGAGASGRRSRPARPRGQQRRTRRNRRRVDGRRDRHRRICGRAFGRQQADLNLRAVGQRHRRRFDASRRRRDLRIHARRDRDLRLRRARGIAAGGAAGAAAAASWRVGPARR